MSSIIFKAGQTLARNAPKIAKSAANTVGGSLPNAGRTAAQSAAMAQMPAPARLGAKGMSLARAQLPKLAEMAQREALRGGKDFVKEGLDDALQTASGQSPSGRPSLGGLAYSIAKQTALNNQDKLTPGRETTDKLGADFLDQLRPD